MSRISTIPNRVPKPLLRDLKNEKYDNIILFALAAYGPHKLKEFINDPKKSIENRMDETIFHKWVEDLKNATFIEEYQRDGETMYKITPQGEDEFMNRLESITSLNRLVNRLFKTFEGFFGPLPPKKEVKSKPTSGNVMSYKHYVFGLLSINWHLNSLFEAGDYAKTLGSEEKVSLGMLFENNAVKYADRPAVIYEDVSYTYKELNEWINRYANYFISLDIKRGDVINVLLENRPELMFVIGAMAKIGSIGSLINTKQRSASLIHSLKLNQAKFNVIGEELLEAFENVRNDLELTSEDKLFFLEDSGEIPLPEGYINLEEKVEDQDTSLPSTIHDIIGRDPYVYIFTSGTTGLPKAAPIRHVHSLSSSSAWGQMALNMQPDDVMYITLPLIHSNAVNIGWMSALSGGSAVALARKFSVRNFWKDAQKYKATCFNYIGEVCRYLLNRPPNPDDRNHDVYKIAGNGLRPEIWNEFKERFGIREVYEHYGATEIKGMFCNYFNRNFTIGVNFDPYVIVKYDIDADEPIQDENGFFQKVDEGEAGLLLMKIHSSVTFAGYTDKEATNKKIIRNPFGNNETWLNTGDLIRNIGYYHAQFVDRLGDTFRWKGENVSTTEVEDLMCSFEQIKHSSVYGVIIPNTEGRAGMASIITGEDHEKFNFGKLLNILQENLPNYARPQFIRFLTELSTTVTFKIKKSDMKKVGFDIKKTNDPIHVLLPGSSEYVRLTKEIHDNILSGKYRF